jgi:hypothetical protein
VIRVATADQVWRSRQRALRASDGVVQGHPTGSGCVFRLPANTFCGAINGEGDYAGFPATLATELGKIRSQAQTVLSDLMGEYGRASDAESDTAANGPR